MHAPVGCRNKLPHLGALKRRPGAEAEGMRDLAPGEELVHVLGGAGAAREQCVSRHLEGTDHAIMMVCRQPAHAIPACAMHLPNSQFKPESEVEASSDPHAGQH